MVEPDRRPVLNNNRPGGARPEDGVNPLDLVAALQHRGQRTRRQPAHNRDPNCAMVQATPTPTITAWADISNIASGGALRGGNYTEAAAWFRSLERYISDCVNTADCPSPDALLSQMAQRCVAGSLAATTLKNQVIRDELEDAGLPPVGPVAPPVPGGPRPRPYTPQRGLMATMLAFKERVKEGIHRSPTELKQKVQHMTHIDPETKQPYDSPGAFMSQLITNFAAANTGGGVQLVTMLETEPLIYWALNLLQPPLLHSTLNAVEGMGTKVQTVLLQRPRGQQATLEEIAVLVADQT